MLSNTCSWLECIISSGRIWTPLCLYFDKTKPETELEQRYLYNQVTLTSATGPGAEERGAARSLETQHQEELNFFLFFLDYFHMEWLIVHAGGRSRPAAPRPSAQLHEQKAQQHPVLEAMESKGLLRCKIVVVGDSQCGKTALLHVFAKDSYPEVSVKTEKTAAATAAPGA